MAKDTLKIQCFECGRNFSVTIKAMPKRGAVLECPACHYKFRLKEYGTSLIITTYEKTLDDERVIATIPDGKNLKTIQIPPRQGGGQQSLRRDSSKKVAKSRKVKQMKTAHLLKILAGYALVSLAIVIVVMSFPRRGFRLIEKYRTVSKDKLANIAAELEYEAGERRKATEMEAGLGDVFQEPDETDNRGSERHVPNQVSIQLLRTGREILRRGTVQAYNDALDKFKEAYAKDPENLEAEASIGETYIYMGSFILSINFLNIGVGYVNAVLDSDPRHLIALRAKGLYWAAAARLYMSTLKIDGVDDKDREKKGWSVVNTEFLKRFDSAEKLVRRSLNDAPEDLETQLTLALVLMHNPAKDSEVEGLLKSTATVRWVEPPFNLAIFYFLRERYKKSRRYVRRTMKISPTHQSVRALDTIAALRLGRQPPMPNEKMALKIRVMERYLDSYAKVRKVFEMSRKSAQP